MASSGAWSQPTQLQANRCCDSHHYANVSSRLFLLSLGAAIASSINVADEKSLADTIEYLISTVSELKDENVRLRNDLQLVQEETKKLSSSSFSSKIHQQQQQPESSIPKTTPRIGNLRQEPPPPPPPSPSQQQHSLRGADASRRSQGTSDNYLSSSSNHGDSLMAARIMSLEAKLACVSDDSDSENLYLEGCNLHIRDGSGSTAGSPEHSSNNKGNLIVGYNEDALEDNDAPAICSLAGAEYRDNPALCRQHGGMYGKNLKLGHHNIIVGAGHSYTQHSGIVVGFESALAGVGASILSGRWNEANGELASLVGGAENVAIGPGSAVVGGYDNVAHGSESTIIGGSLNSASGEASSIIGGSSHQSRGMASFVGGGSSNLVTGDWSSITSGYGSEAHGRYSSVCGGYKDVVDHENNAFLAGDGLQLEGYN